MKVRSLDEQTCRRYIASHGTRRNRKLARKPSFGHLIRETRKRRGVSVVEVAERVGVSVASLYMWETDRDRPRDAKLNALCKVLKLPIRSTRELAAG